MEEYFIRYRRWYDKIPEEFGTDPYPIEEITVDKLKAVWVEFPPLKKLMEAGYLDSYTDKYLQDNVRNYYEMEKIRNKFRWKG